MSKFELKESEIRIDTKNNRFVSVKYDSKHIVGINECLEILINNLVLNNMNWKKNDNLHLMNLVSKCSLFINKYKRLDVEEKKNLVLQIIMKYVNENVDKLKLTQDYLLLLNTGIDTIVEPALELVILTSLKKLKLKKSIMSCLKL
jgi:hypothetical protein